MTIKKKVSEAISIELNYQRLMSVKNNWKTDKSPIEFAVLMEAEIQEAKDGYCKNDESNFGRNRIEHEILQTVCLGLEMLESLPEEELQKLIDSTIAASKYQFGVGAEQPKLIQE